MLRALRPFLTPAGGRLVIAAPDDDAAAWRAETGLTVATVDTLVEGIDFRTEWPDFDFRTLGRRLLSINLSDLAAMGADPRHALVSLALRTDVSVEAVRRLYTGIAQQAGRFDCTIAGGDLSATRGPLTLTAALVGSIPPGRRPLRRQGGRPGWLLAVTGRVGSAWAGLQVLEAGRRPKTHAERRWVRAFMTPEPRLAAARALQDAGVRVAGDISDGLAREVEKLAEPAGCGAIIDVAMIPVDPSLTWRSALRDSEDFELICAAPTRRMAAAADAVRRRCTLPLTVIGRLTARPGIQLVDGERPLALKPRGFEHFR